MDLNTAMIFAQIVSLMADYAAQKGSRDTLNIQEFVEWSTTHGHAELMRAIERNQAITIGVKAALSEGKTELLEKLRALDEKLTAVAAGLGPLDDIARATHPQAVLSAQARDLLTGFEQCEAESAIEIQEMAGNMLLFVGTGTNGDENFVPSEARFFDDDLAQLIGLGLLSLSHNRSGGRVFRPTRLGAQIGKQLLGAITR